MFYGLQMSMSNVNKLSTAILLEKKLEVNTVFYMHSLN